MKKVVLKLSALALALAMMLSMVSCRKNKDDKKVNSSAPAVSSEAPADVSEPDDIGDIDDGEDDFDDFDDDFNDDDWSIVVDRPETDGAISRGVKYSFTESDTGDDDFDDIIDDDPDEWDDDDVGDIEEESYEYEPIIQKAGKAVSGGTRKIEIDNSTAGVEFTGFYGFGCNVYPTQFTLEAQTRFHDIPAYSEINAKRFNDSAPRYARSWFQCDWFITNEAGDDYDKYDTNWEANPDYQNWMKGVYNFYSDEMNSAVEYWQMLEEAGTEIYLAYNWKNARRIQAWFGNDPMHAQIAAPRDLKAYAKGAVALFKHVRYERGLTNFNTLAFYNEPEHTGDYSHGGTGDYTTIGNKCLYWMNMVKECYILFKNDPQLKDVVIASSDQSTPGKVVSESYVSPYLRNHGSQYIDMFTFHEYPSYYYKNESDPMVYNTLFDIFLFIENWYPGNNNWITEYFSSGYDIENSSGGVYEWDNVGWSHSAAAYYIAAANTGMHGILKWSFVGGGLLDPLFFNPANSDTSSWKCPVDIQSTLTVKNSFYEESLMNTYVKPNSNVHQITWEGDDMRCSAFTSKDGKDFSLLVEANEDSVNRVLNVNLKKSLGGKKLYVFKFDFTNAGAALGTDKNAQASVVPCIDVIDNVTTSFKSPTGLIDGDYGIYIFTTIKPITQIEVYKRDGASKVQAVANSIEKTDTLTITPEFVENVGVTNPAMSNAQVEWTITQYSNAAVKVGKVEEQRVRREKIAGSDMGKIATASDGSVTYTPPADAKAGDVVALRCSLKSDADRYAVAMIEIE